MLSLDRVKQELKEPLQKVEESWILQTAPILSASLGPYSKNVLNSELLDAVADLPDLEKVDMLEQLLNRAALDDEVAEWLELLANANHMANKKRRLTLLAMEHAEYREVGLKCWPSDLTEDDILAFRLVDKKQRYPVANLKPKVSKDVERAKLVQELVEYVTELGLPVVSEVLEAVNAGTILTRIAGGRRVSTLKQKLHILRRMSQWMMAVHQVPFPNRPYMLLDYIEERAQEPCGPSVPAAILSAVKFIEMIGGVAEEKQIGKCSMIDSQIKDVALELMSDQPRAKRKAPPMMVNFVAFWEQEVCSELNPFTLRVTCFVKVLRVWACLRSSDLAGISSKSLKLDEAGNLSGAITISKTTGKGKAVGITYFHVSKDAWLLDPSWIATGLKLLKEHTEPAQFLLPLETRDRTAFSTQEPTYTDWSIISRKLLASACGICFKADEGSELGYTFEAGDVRLLRADVQQFWTEHSDRATLPTWAKAQGWSKADRDYLGRWKPTESDEYVRISKTAILNLQGTVAGTIRRSPGVDRAAEHEVLENLGDWMKNRGYKQEEVADQLSKLKYWGDLGNQEVPAASQLAVDDDGFGPLPDVEEPVEQVGKGQLVVSLEKGNRPQTLHCVGRCWRVPGLHFSRYIILDREEVTKPDPRVMVPYDRICKDCYPGGKFVDDQREDDSSSESSEGSGDH